MRMEEDLGEEAPQHGEIRPHSIRDRHRRPQHPPGEHVGPKVLTAVVLHNAVGLALGYGAAALFLRDERKRRAISIEVGMQNSGLGVALAMQYFSAAAALPSAVFSIWHNLSGSALAAYWSQKGTG